MITSGRGASFSVDFSCRLFKKRAPSAGGVSKWAQLLPTDDCPNVFPYWLEKHGQENEEDRNCAGLRQTDVPPIKPIYP